MTLRASHLDFSHFLILMLVVAFCNPIESFPFLFPQPRENPITTPITTTKSSFSKTKTETSVEPILILPGLSASQLQAKLQGNKPPHFYCKTNSDWFRIWLDSYQLLPGVIDCLVHNLELHYDIVDNKFSNTSGVSISPMDFGSLSGAPYLANFSEMLIANGYELDVSLRIASFDWRLDSRSYINDGEFQKVANLVEEMYYRNNNTRVHLVGHSYGGPFAYWFVSRFAQQQWKDKYIASIITLGAPWLGTSLASVCLVNMTELFKQAEPSSRESLEKLATMLKTFPSVISMLPSETYHKGTIISTPSKNYTASMNFELLTDIGANVTALIRKNNADDYNDLSHPGTNVYCIFGVELPTPHSFNFKSDNFSNMTASIGDGDGSIELESLEFCNQWINQNPNYRVEVQQIPKAEHATMITDPDVVKYILSVTIRSVPTD